MNKIIALPLHSYNFIIYGRYLTGNTRFKNNSVKIDLGCSGWEIDRKFHMKDDDNVYVRVYRNANHRKYLVR